MTFHDELLTLLDAATWTPLDKPFLGDYGLTNVAKFPALLVRPGLNNESRPSSTTNTQVIDTDQCLCRLKCKTATLLNTYYDKIRAIILGTNLVGGWYQVTNYIPSRTGKTNEYIFSVNKTIWKVL